MTLYRTTLLVLSVAGSLSLATPVSAKPEFAQKEKAACPACHVMTEFPKKKNSVGECYKRHGNNHFAACQKDPKN